MSRKQKSRKATAAAPAVARVPEPAPRREPAAAPARRPAPGPDVRAWALLAVAVVVVAFLVYANSLGNGFVFDDGDVVLGDPHIRDLANWKALLADSYRPLRTITYAVDYAVWGMQPSGFRMTNIALHAANGVLALLVARKLTGGARAAAVVAALVLVLHPAQSESVAYVSGRRDVLFAAFYLASFLCYTRFTEAVTARARLAWLAATGLGFVLSLMSKEMAASLPLACLLWDVYRATAPDASGERAGLAPAVARVARERAVLIVPAVALLGAFAYYTLSIRRATTRAVDGQIEFWGGSLANNMLTVPLTYAHYVKVALFPVTLAAQYLGAFDPASGLADWRVLPALLLLAGLVVAAFVLMLRTSFRVAGFGIAWFVVTLLPASQVFPHHEIVADHYLYLPVLGLGLAAADLLRAPAVPAVWRRRGLVAAAVVLALFAARTYARNQDWKDEETLWEATFEAVPGSPRAAYNLGFAATQRGDHQRAERLYKLALERDPTFLPAYRNLASTYGRLNRPDEARAVYERALGIDLAAAARAWHMTPQALEAAFNVEIALVDARKGQLDAARERLEKVVAADPNTVRAQDAIISILQSRGELDAAVRAAQARADAEPGDEGARLRLAYMLWKVNRFDEAYAHAARVLESDDKSSLAHFLAAVYFSQVHPERAPSRFAYMEHFDRAVQWAPSYLDQEMIERKRGEVMGAPAL